MIILAVAGLLLKLLIIGDAIDGHDLPSTGAPIAATLLVLAPLLVPLLWVPSRPRLQYVILLNVAATMVALGDLWHFRFYADVPSLAEIGGWHPGIAARSLPALLRPRDALAIVDIALVSGCSFLRFRRAALQGCPARKPEGLRYVGPVSIGAVLVVAICAVRVIYVVRADREEVLEYGYQRQNVVHLIGLAGYHAYDAAVYAWFPLRGHLTPGKMDAPSVARLIIERDSQRFRSRLAGIARGRSLIVVSAESLQAFALDMKVGGQPVTPNLTAFAARSMRFDQFYDQTHMGTTADAEFVMLNSLMPLTSGAVSTRYEANTFRALPHVLRDHGYATLSACAEPPAVWNMGGMHPRLGFSRSLFAAQFRWTESVGVGLDDDSFFEQMNAVLASQRDPFFAYLITSSNHHPYQIPSRLHRLSPSALPAGMAGDYLQSVRHFDEAFGRFVARLSSDGVLDRAVVAVVGDHQSWVPDEDLQALWQVAGNGRPASEFEQWRFRRRVPFLVHLPDAAEAGPREKPGGHLNVAPTLLSLLGIDDASVVWLGRDITSAFRSLVVFRDGSFTDGEAAWLEALEGAPKCYARSGHAVPCEELSSLRTSARGVLDASDSVLSGNLVGPISTLLTTAADRAPPRTLGRVLIIAHRGDSANYPENTIAAIQSGFDRGADAVEVDIRLSKDGVAMVFHDDELDRTTDGAGPFEAKTFDEIRRLDAGRWMDRRFAGMRVATLEEAVRAARGRGALLLDLKVNGLAAPVRAVYDGLNVPHHEALIGAWTPEQREEFVREMPGARILRTGAAPYAWTTELFREIRKSGLWGFEIGGHWPRPFLGDAALHDVPVFAYTVNDEHTLRRLIQSGVAGIETDEPALMLRVARSLGAR